MARTRFKIFVLDKTQNARDETRPKSDFKLLCRTRQCGIYGRERDSGSGATWLKTKMFYLLNNIGQGCRIRFSLHLREQTFMFNSLDQIAIQETEQTMLR